MKQLNATSYLIIGAILTFIAAVLGLVIGATFGGNYPVPFEYGGLPGYEGAGLFDAVFLSSVAAIAWSSIALPKLHRKRTTGITMFICLAELILQHLLGIQTGVGLFVLLFAPILWQVPTIQNYNWKG